MDLSICLLFNCYSISSSHKSICLTSCSHDLTYLMLQSRRKLADKKHSWCWEFPIESINAFERKSHKRLYSFKLQLLFVLQMQNSMNTKYHIYKGLKIEISNRQWNIFYNFLPQNMEMWSSISEKRARSN